MAVSFTAGNDFIIPTEDGQTYLGGAGDDTYILSESTIVADSTIVIQDTEGANKIQLVGGLSIASSLVTANAVELTLSNGAKIQILGADAFGYNVGGNALAGVEGTEQTFTEFVEDTLGATVPAEGEDPSEGGEVAVPDIGEDAGTTLTDGLDVLVGQEDVDNVFTAPIVQSSVGFGNVTNTFDSGDNLDGVGGRNILEADLTQVVTGTQIFGPAVSATTENIQEVYLRAQWANLEGGRVDNNVPGVFTARNSGTVDAENMNGVEQWWTQNSRADLVVEDIRSAPEETTFGMDSTDPAVGYYAFFDPASLVPAEFEASSFILLVRDIDTPANELRDISVERITFGFDGEDVSLTGNGLAEANTWAELHTAIETAIAAEGLESVVVTNLGDGSFRFEDGSDDARSFEAGRVLVEVAGNSRTESVQIPDTDRETETIRTDIVLDNVGRTSEGGEMVVGSMSTRGGVEEFNVSVGGDSWLQTLSSTNNALEIVNVDHLEDADGSLYLGAGSEIEGALNRDVREFWYFDNRLAFRDLDGTGGANGNGGGLYDVQVFNADGFSSEIKLSAALTVNSIGKYLEDEVGNELEEVGAFNYTLGDGGNNLFLTVEDNLTREPDFELNIDGGAQDDRINLWDVQMDGFGDIDWQNGNVRGAVNLAKDGISIDGGGGDNTLEIISNTGQRADGRDAYAEVTNIQNLVISAGQNTAQELVAGNIRNATNELDTLTIASWGNIANTQIERMILDTVFTVSGQEQTLPRSDFGDFDQDFGVIEILNLETIPGAEETEFSVNIDNTARSTGVLTITDLLVNWDAGETVVTDTVNLFSNGRLDTANTVQNFEAPEIDELNFFGTQDLAVHVSDLAEDSSFAIDGLELEGDLTLAVNGALLVGDGDDILANADNNNLLALYGALGDDADDDVDVVAPTIEGFQNLMFGLQTNGYLAGLFDVPVDVPVSGTINLENTEDIASYTISGIDDDFTLDNMQVGTVVLGDNTADDAQTFDVSLGGATLTLIADDDAEIDNDVLDLSVATNAAGEGVIDLFDQLLWLGDTTIDIQGFETINLDLPTPANAIAAAGFGDLWVDLRPDADARDLIITGGSTAPDGSVNGLDSLWLTTALPTTLDTVDVQGYDGAFRASLDQFTGTDTEFILGAEDAFITLKGNENIQVQVLEELTDAGITGNISGGFNVSEQVQISITIPLINDDGTIDFTEFETIDVRIDTPEVPAGGTDQEDTLFIMNRLVRAISQETDGLLEGQVTFWSNADGDDEYDPETDTLVYGPSAAAGEYHMNLEIQPAPDSPYTDIPGGLNAVDQVRIEAFDVNGVQVFDSDNVIGNPNADDASLSPTFSGNTDSVPDMHTFNVNGEYQVTFTFTEFDEDANGGLGSQWIINNFSVADDADDPENTDAMTILDLSGLGIGEDDLEDLDFSIGGDNSVFGVEGEWSIDVGVDVDEEAFYAFGGGFAISSEDDGAGPGDDDDDDAPVYTLTAAAATVNEGATVIFNLATENVAEGTEIAYTIDGDVNADDIDGGVGALTGVFVVAADGTATIEVGLIADATTEGAETMTVTLDGLGVAASVIVNDTSVDGGGVVLIPVDITDGSIEDAAGGDFQFNAQLAETNIFAATIANFSAGDVMNINDEFLGAENLIFDTTGTTEINFAFGDMNDFTPSFTINLTSVDEALVTQVDNAADSVEALGVLDAAWGADWLI